MQRIPVIEHPPPAGIARRYRTCPDAAEKTWWHVRRLVTRPNRPMSAGRAARAVGLTPAWGRTLLGRWNDRGPGGRAVGRKGSGAGPALTPARPAGSYAAPRAD